MKALRPSSNASLVPAIALLLVSLPVFAADRDWIALFDGKSTDALRGYKTNAFPDKVWKVEDGALHAIPGRGGVDLVTKEKYRDFELELEWKVAAGGNSGVIYRLSEDVPGPAWHTGPEMQVFDDSRLEGKRSTHSAGALYDLIVPNESAKANPPGEWNRFRVVFKDNHVEHWLNGAKIVEYTWGSPEIQALITKSKFAKLEKFMKNEEGLVAFQHHGQEVWYRNIRIRRL
jgi:hypothetical protein